MILIMMFDYNQNYCVSYCWLVLWWFKSLFLICVSILWYWLLGCVNIFQSLSFQICTSVRTSSLICNSLTIHLLNVLKLMNQSMVFKTWWGWVCGGVGVRVFGRARGAWGVCGRWPPSGGGVGVALFFWKKRCLWDYSPSEFIS